jgi:hypothetical protein
VERLGEVFGAKLDPAIALVTGQRRFGHGRNAQLADVPVVAGNGSIRPEAVEQRDQ